MPANIGTAEKQFFRSWAHMAKIVEIGAPDDKHPYEGRVFAWTVHTLANFDNALPRTLYVLLQEAKGIFEDREAKRARAKAANKRGGPGIENTHKQCWRKILLKLKDFYLEGPRAAVKPPLPPPKSPPDEIEIKSGDKEDTMSKLTDTEIQKLIVERDQFAKKAELLEATLTFERKESECQLSEANAKTVQMECEIEHWKDQCAYKEELLIKKDKELQGIICSKDKMLQEVERQYQQLKGVKAEAETKPVLEEKKKKSRCAKKEMFMSPIPQPDPGHGGGFLSDSELRLKSDEVLEPFPAAKVENLNFDPLSFLSLS